MRLIWDGPGPFLWAARSPTDRSLPPSSQRRASDVRQERRYRRRTCRKIDPLWCRPSHTELADGQVKAIRLIKIARDTAVKAQSGAIITLKAMLVGADQELRHQLEP
jgi:hypothetical protein